MKTWLNPEVMELPIENTFANTPDASNNQYKRKDNQCECGHNTNFKVNEGCTDPNHSIIFPSDDTSMSDGLS